MPVEKLIYQSTVRATVETFAGGAVALGVGIAYGGPGRFVAPSLATARAMPGGPYTWAAAIGGSGLLTLTGAHLGWRRHVVMAGLAAQGLIYLFLDISLWVTAVQDPTTPLTGCFAYLMVAVGCGVLYSAGHGLDAVKHAEEEPPP